jgi:MarR family transcriptional regulator, organic hydroperoxide resistance regulator
MGRRSSRTADDDLADHIRFEPVVVARRLGRVLEFIRRLWALDHALQSTSKWMQARLGVTWPQRLSIRMIGHFPGISAGALAELLHLHPSTLTGILQRLSARRLIRRVADPRDARRALLWLTRSGRRINRGRKGTVEAAVTRTLTSASARDLAIVRETLSRTATELEREVAAISIARPGQRRGKARSGKSSSGPTFRERRSSTGFMRSRRS